jgi:2,3-bisphosphoglycerate-independent phosphoglycerate mutase
MIRDSSRYSKCVVVIVDGLGDLPLSTLGGKTPLEAALTPNLDLLAGSGYRGVVDPIEAGTIPNTHSGAGILLGLPAAQADSLQRGPVEAAGAGRVLRDGEVALRANFASVTTAGEGLVVTDRRAGRITQGTDELSDAIRRIELGDGVSAEFRSTDQHRGVLVLSGESLDAAVSDTDPLQECVPCVLPDCKPLRAGAARTAAKVNHFVRASHAALRTHQVNVARTAAGRPPANVVITRGAGQQLATDNVIRQMGLSAAVVTACNTVRGLGRIFGFEIVADARFTADLDTDIEAKFAAARTALGRHDLVFVHVKAADICAHDRQPEAKRGFIERLDRSLAPILHHGFTIAVSADHTTDSLTGMHSADPVPSLLYAPQLGQAAGRVKFGESACLGGNMPRQTSAQFLQTVLSAMAGRPPPGGV